mmetsp:Transcript_48856/g.147210  ORF Transcript_48856/g.147210 Transcript_48856/m.147210 type:complete len:196 (+) Transcript_48856:871-1458(+)
MGEYLAVADTGAEATGFVGEGFGAGVGAGAGVGEAAGAGAEEVSPPPLPLEVCAPPSALARLASTLFSAAASRRSFCARHSRCARAVRRSMVLAATSMASASRRRSSDGLGSGSGSGSGEDWSATLSETATSSSGSMGDISTILGIEGGYSGKGQVGRVRQGCGGLDRVLGVQRLLQSGKPFPYLWLRRGAGGGG